MTQAADHTTTHTLWRYGRGLLVEAVATGFGHWRIRETDTHDQTFRVSSGAPWRTIAGVTRAYQDGGMEFNDWQPMPVDMFVAREAA